MLQGGASSWKLGLEEAHYSGEFIHQMGSLPNSELYGSKLRNIVTDQLAHC
jgi:hypothetical protein